MIDTALLWIIVGGMLEPVWVICLKKYNDHRCLFWAVMSAVFIVASPMCLSFAMRTMPVGVSYSIWTGLGAVFTMIAGMVLYKEKIDRLKVLFVFMIIAGIVGLQLSAEVMI